MKIYKNTEKIINIINSKSKRTNFLKIIWGENFYQIDKGRKEKENLINGSVFKQLKTSHQRYLDVFKNIGISTSLSKIDFPKKINLSKLATTALRASAARSGSEGGNTP